MRIAILSRARGCYSTRRLREAALARGHDVKVLDTLRFSMSVEKGNPELFYKSAKLSRYDAVIPRIGASITFYGTAVVRQFEQMGVFTLNGSHAITVARDKLRALQVLSRAADRRDDARRWSRGTRRCAARAPAARAACRARR